MDIGQKHRWTLGGGFDFTSAKDKSASSLNPAAGLNTLLFPVAGGGAIGVNNFINSTTRADYRKYGGHINLTYWHHQNPDSHLGFFGEVALHHSRLDSRSDIAAGNAAFGNLDHRFDIDRKQFSWINKLGITGKTPLTNSLFLSGGAFVGLVLGRAKQRSSSCLDGNPAAGCDGLFSTASNSSSKNFVSPEFGVTAALTALLSCSDRARLLGACALVTLEAGYLNSPFAKSSRQTALGQTIGLKTGRLNQFHAALKIAVPLSQIFSNRGQ